MPRKPEMTWVPNRRLWRRMYRGKVYTVSCRQLRELGHEILSETKEGSYAAANAWWHKKEHELWEAERKPVRPPLPLEDLAAASLGDPAILTDPRKAAAFLFSEVLRRRKARQEMENSPPVPPAEGEGVEQVYQSVIQLATEDLLKRLLLFNEPIPQELADRLPPARLQQIERAAHCFRGEPATAPEKTLAARISAWLKKQQTLVEAGQMTAARCGNNRKVLKHLETYLGPDSDVAIIDAEKLEGFYLHCLSKIRRPGHSEGWSVAYARDVFATAKQFLKWLWEQGIIELPKNFSSRFKFDSALKAVKTWTVDEFQKTLGEASGKLKLALLLMVNCGMTQKDVSDLLDTEVDWTSGSIIRKRSKTAALESVPTVNYPLWPLTFELLKKYRSGGERVLLTESGKPYVRKELRDGKLVKADGFAANFEDLRKRLSLQRPLKGLRKLGASMLATHKDYGRFTSHYLGHAPQSMGDKHYVVPPQRLFDEAVLWLGRQLGEVQ